MNDGFPSMLPITGNTLILANVPFAPAPCESVLAVNSDGGPTGADLQRASFRLVRDFHEQNRIPVKACFVTWTVGNLKNNKWEIPEICRTMFAPAEIRWTLIDHEYDAPELSNPAPVSAMLRHLSHSQDSVTTHLDSEEEYARLENILTMNGYTHIAFGILECSLGSSHG